MEKKLFHFNHKNKALSAYLQVFSGNGCALKDSSKHSSWTSSNSSARLTPSVLVKYPTFPPQIPLINPQFNPHL